MSAEDDRNNPILASIKDTELDVSIILREGSYTIGELLNLNPGSVLSFGAPATNTGNLSVSGRNLAKGAVVQDGECYALKVEEVFGSA